MLLAVEGLLSVSFRVVVTAGPPLRAIFTPLPFDPSDAWLKVCVSRRDARRRCPSVVSAKPNPNLIGTRKLIVPRKIRHAEATPHGLRRISNTVEITAHPPDTRTFY